MEPSKLAMRSVALPLKVEELIERLENYYDFECTGGPLKNCREWQQLVSLTNERQQQEKLTSRELHKGTGDVLKDLQHAQRFTEDMQDHVPGPLGKEIDFIDRALRVAMGEIKHLRKQITALKSKPPAALTPHEGDSK